MIPDLPRGAAHLRLWIERQFPGDSLRGCELTCKEKCEQNVNLTSFCLLSPNLALDNRAGALDTFCIRQTTSFLQRPALSSARLSFQVQVQEGSHDNAGVLGTHQR